MNLATLDRHREICRLNVELAIEAYRQTNRRADADNVRYAFQELADAAADYERALHRVLHGLPFDA
jgi:rubrerythrin